MKLSEFIERASRHLNPERPHIDPELMIKYNPPFTTVGGTPCTPVKAYMNGFDWDSGKFILVPEQPLTLADAEFAEKFKKLQDEYGWAKYENRNLKSDIKKLQKQIADLTKDKSNV